MPEVLKKLSPSTVLDPVKLWKDVKAKRLARAGGGDPIGGGGERGKGGKGKGGGKGKHQTKKDDIIRANEERRRALRLLIDWGKLFNLTTTTAGRRMFPRNLKIGQIRTELKKIEKSIVTNMNAERMPLSILLDALIEVGIIFVFFLSVLYVFPLSMLSVSLDNLLRILDSIRLTQELSESY